MTRFRNGYLFIFSLALLCIWIGCTPPLSSMEVVTVQIPNGATLNRITEILSQNEILRYPLLFRIRVRMIRKQNQLKAGHYAFRKSMRHQEILENLLSGKTIRYKITIPEGLTFKEIGKMFGKTRLINEKAFIEACQDRQFLKELLIPGENVEGFLFPSTYFLTHDQPPRELIREMVKNYKRVFSAHWLLRGQELGFNELEIVTLASIIEKETGLAGERKRISAVFHNRLRKGMRLQTDPSVIYGLVNFNGNLTRKDLETYTPYNTYVIRGLPPGAIANPGKEALEAALYPLDCDDLFFVAKNDGSHHFSTNLRDHENAVNQYQRRKRINSQAARGNQ